MGGPICPDLHSTKRKLEKIEREASVSMGKLDLSYNDFEIRRGHNTKAINLVRHISEVLVVPITYYKTPLCCKK